MEKLSEMLLHEKPVKMLITLRNQPRNYATTLSKAADCTYSHTMKVLEVFEKKGLIESEKSGRIRYIKLTKKGEEVAELFDAIVRLLKKIDDGKD